MNVSGDPGNRVPVLSIHKPDFVFEIVTEKKCILRKEDVKLNGGLSSFTGSFDITSNCIQLRWRHSSLEPGNRENTTQWHWWLGWQKWFNIAMEWNQFCFVLKDHLFSVWWRKLLYLQCVPSPERDFGFSYTKIAPTRCTPPFQALDFKSVWAKKSFQNNTQRLS